jgi:hypothetical protein
MKVSNKERSQMITEHESYYTEYNNTHIVYLHKVYRRNSIRGAITSDTLNVSRYGNGSEYNIELNNKSTVIKRLCTIGRFKIALNKRHLQK